MAVDTTVKILVIVLIALILVGFAGTLAEWLSKLLGFKIDAASEGSVLALRCAINSIATGAISDYTCLTGSAEVEAFTNTEDALLYIQSHSISENSITANIIYDAKKLTKKLSNMLTGLAVFFGGSAEGETSEVIGYGFKNTVVVCGDDRTVYPSIGWKCCRGKKGLTTNYYWDYDCSNNELPEYLKLQTERVSQNFQLLSYLLPPFYGYNNLKQLLTGGIDEEPADSQMCMQNVRGSRDFKCVVVNLDLKQKNYNIFPPWNLDPDYIVYFNSFPHGEDVTWKRTEESGGTVLAVVFGVMTTVVIEGFFKGTTILSPFLKKIGFFEKFGLETGIIGKAMVKTKDAGATVFKKVLNKKDILEGQEEFMKFYLITHKNVPTGDAERAAKEMRDALDDGIKNDKNVGEFLEDLKSRKTIKKLLKDKKIKKGELENIGRVYVLLRSGNEDAIKNFKFILDADNQVAGLLKRIDATKTITVGGRKMKLEDFLEETFKEFRNNKITEKKAYERIIEAYKQYFKENPQNAEKMVGVIEKTAEQLEDMSTPLKKLIEKRTTPVVTAYMKDLALNPYFHYAVIDALEQAGYLDNEGWLQETAKQVAKCEAVLKYRVGGLAGCSAFSILAAHAVVNNAVKLKEASVGANALGLYNLRFIFTYGDAKKYDLVREAMPYYVYLNRMSMSGERRFYLASPCKASFLVRRADNYECMFKKYDSGECKDTVKSFMDCGDIDYDSVVNGNSLRLEDVLGYDPKSKDDEKLYRDLKDYYSRYMEIKKDSAPSKEERCIAMLNFCELLNDGEYDVCSQDKTKSCAFAAKNVFAGGVVESEEDGKKKMYATFNDVYVVGIERIDHFVIPKFMIFERTGQASQDYYDYSSFRWYLEERASVLPEDARVSKACMPHTIKEAAKEKLAKLPGIGGFFDSTASMRVNAIEVVPFTANHDEGEANYCYAQPNDAMMIIKYVAYAGLIAFDLATGMLGSVLVAMAFPAVDYYTDTVALWPGNQDMDILKPKGR